ncbi:N-acetyltransferase 5 [Microbotryomycetes sp. JL221]|nr:N-acetyltransferase 5 [Microbotryomycetes sp. JL221]
MSVVDQLPVLPTTTTRSTFEQDKVAKTISGKRIRVPPRVTLGEITPNNVGTVKKLNYCLFPIAYTDKFYKDILDPTVTPEQYSRLVYYQDVAVGNIVCKLEPVNQPEPTTLVETVTTTTSTTTTEANSGGKAKLYVMTLGVLSPYRRQGLASKLISHVIEQAQLSHTQQQSQKQTTSTTSGVNGTTNGTTSTKKQKKDNNKKDNKDEDHDSNKQEALVQPAIESLYLHVQTSNDEAKAFWERHGFQVKARRSVHSVVDTIKNYYRKIEPRDAWLLERKITGSVKTEIDEN